MVLILLVVLSLIPSLLFAHAFSRSVKEIGTALGHLRNEKYNFVPQPVYPAELADLGTELRELGLFLEERDRKSSQDNQSSARDLRQEALQRFGQGVAREVQKSLAGVIGFVEIALRQPGVEGQLKNYLTLIDQETRAGREALDRILRYVREEPFPTEPLDLNSLLVETSRGFVDTSGQVKLELKMAQDLPKVKGDAGLLKHVLNTLINNAREAMLPDGGTLELSTSLDQNSWVVVMVKDTGRGIPEEDQSKVFTPFFTTKGSRKGAGLNLAVSERIIEQHGGKLDFWSNLGIGSVFFVNLPPEEATATEPT
jgi:signal transduction histidine kinase